MSHEYMKCKGCGNPFMEHLMSHTSRGSFCSACYKKLGLKPTDEELGIKVCRVCNSKFLQRNFKTAYPDDVCGKCGEAFIKNEKEKLSAKEVQAQPERTRDVLFHSEENQARDVVTAFIVDSSGKRVGMRVWSRKTGAVTTQPLPTTDAYYWNINFLDGKLIPKCCRVTEFPEFTFKSGEKLTQNTILQFSARNSAGAWVLGEYLDGRLCLISAAGQVKDVNKATAYSYLKLYGIANAYADGDEILAKTGEFPIIR